MSSTGGHAPAGYHGPINHDPAPGEAGIIIYGYVPRLAVGISACILFFVFLFVHTWYGIRHRNVRVFQFLLAFGCVMEMIGYGFRIASHYRPFVVIDFVLNYFMIVCAPIFFSAALYLALAAILRRMPKGTKYAFLSPKTIIITFVVIDVVTILTQVIGAALVGVAESAQGEGKKSPIQASSANDILLTGLAVQSASFLIFLMILLNFIYKLRTSPRTAVHPSTFLILTLLTSSLLIFLRTLFRLAETAAGVFSALSSHEGYFAGLEYAPVVVAVFLWVICSLGPRLAEMENEDDSEKDGEIGKEELQ